MNRSSEARPFVVSAGGVGTTPSVITMNSPHDVPRKGFLLGIRLTRTAGAATTARAVVKVGGETVAVYDDGSGGQIAIDGTGDAFDFADTKVYYERGAGVPMTVEVECDTAGNTIEARLIVGGP